MKIARLAIDRPVTTWMFYIAIVLLGLVSLRQLSVDLLPNISYPRLSVLTQYPGVAPEEIETLVTTRLEAGVSRIPGLRRVESVSKEGVSFMTLEFAWGTDMDFTMLHTREALDNVRDNLPEGTDNPTIIPLDPQSKPIIVLAVSGESNLLELKSFAEELVKPRLEQIEGIGSAEITGGIDREIHVEIDPGRLALYGLTINEVAARIDAFNRNLQGGTIRKGMFKYAIRVVGEFESIKEIGEVHLKTTKEKGVIRLRDIAQVKDAVKERQGMTRLNREESIGILVRKESGANTVKVTRLAKDVIAQIKKENPKTNIFIVSEQAGYIESVIKAVTNQIVQGAILVFLVVLLFLQEFKSPLIINIVIPISIIATFNMLYFGNITLNIMSLGGLALGVGMLDDCADVISENIFRHRSLGKSPAEAAYIGTKEVGGAVAATALTTVVVFLPIIYVHGVAGPLFKDAALTVSFSLMASLLVSLTLLPMLQARKLNVRTADSGPGLDESALKKTAKTRTKIQFLLGPFKGLQWLLYKILKGISLVLNFLISYVTQLLALLLRSLAYPFKPVLRFVFKVFNFFYHPFVRHYKDWLVWSLDHKGRIAVAALIFFGGTFSIGALLPRENMPKIKATSFELQLKTPVDYSLEQTADIVAALEQYLKALPPVKVTFSQTGIVSGMESTATGVSLNSAKIFVEVAKSSQLEQTLEGLRGRLADFPDVTYSVAREESALAEFLASSSAEVALKVQGTDLNKLKEISEDLVGRLREVKGLVDLNTNIGEGKPEFRIKIRKDALAKYAGLSPGLISDFLVNAVRGKVATQFNEMEKKYDVLVRLEESSRATIESLLNGQLPHQGTLIPLRELVTVEPARGPQEIRRENQQREILVTANLHETKLSKVVPAINAQIKRIGLPEGYRIVFGGEQEEMSKSFTSLILALLLAVLLTYMIMAAQFESLLHPFLVMLTLPMGAAGAFVSLWIGRQTLNVMSIIGMVVLVGLVVDDAIVEIDYINQLRRSGKALRESVVEGCLTRLRAILMASLDTVAGLIPMSLGLERGSELLKPLGIVVAGGLLFSTLLTLILIPVIYEWVEKKKEMKKAPARVLIQA
ncbi:MAG: efflux RND transporter permease subunit [Candidatus Aminicenantes bacterium]|nr:efflux RND transporter permease subunit [Candidatus Aminicenantes bacterium]